METREKKQANIGAAGANLPPESGRGEIAAERYSTLNSFIQELSSTLASVDIAEVDDNVHAALGQIGTVFGAERAALYQVSRDGERLGATHEWCAPDAPSVIHHCDDLPADELPWVMRRMKEREPVVLASIGDLPEEAAAEKVEFQLQDIRSLVLFPIHFSESLTGILALCTIRDENSWPDETIPMLRIAGEIFAHALVGHRSIRYLRENEKKCRHLVETMNDGLVTMDEQGVITFANGRFYRTLGYTPEEILGRRATDVITDFRSPSFEEGSAPGRGRAGDAYEVGLLHKDGHSTPADISSAPIHDPEGNFRGTTMVLRDVTAQKESERILQESEWRFRSVFNLTPVAVFLETTGGDILDANAEAESLTGYSRHELLERNAGDLLLATPESGSPEEESREIATEGNFTEAVCLHKNGNRVPVRVHAQVIRGSKEDLILLVAEDIQDWKKYEKRMREHSDLLMYEVEARTRSLRAANTLLMDEIREREAAQSALSDLNRRLEGRVRERTAELEESHRELRTMDKRKDTFVSMVSHELRTPLTCILSSSEYLLGDHEERACRREYIEIIHTESERLIRFINDVLDLSRIEAGGMPWNDGFLQLRNVVDHVLWIQEQMIAKKSIRMETEIGRDLYVFADHDRIQQVLTNLVTNALKFSSENGTLRITAERTREKNNKETADWVRLTITDQGIGIAENVLETIFDKFNQIVKPGKGDRSPKGSGLGLPICREIVEHYGGRIWAESRPEEGSSFVFLLPAVSPPVAGDKDDSDIPPDENRAYDTQGT